MTCRGPPTLHEVSSGVSALTGHKHTTLQRLDGAVKVADSRSLHEGVAGGWLAVLAPNVGSGPAHDIVLLHGCAERTCALSSRPHQSTASSVAACGHLRGLQILGDKAGRGSQWSCRLLDWFSETRVGRTCRSHVAWSWVVRLPAPLQHCI